MKFKKGNIPWNKGNGIYKECLTCGKKIYVILSKDKYGRGKFCNFKCWKGFSIKKSKEFKLNKDLAEFIGVIIGDGCINKFSNCNRYRIFISGNPIEDKNYMEDYLPKLIKKCINKKLKPFKASNGAYLLQFTNESFRLFLKRIGIKENKTKIVKIPNKIKNDEELLKSCIRGIGDTDFTLLFTKRKKNMNYYPRISAQFASKNLVKDLENSLRNLGFTLNVKYDYEINDKRGYSWITNQINLDGPNNLNKWLNLIGFNNPRIMTKYLVWKKLGYLPKNILLPERLKILNDGQRGGGFNG